MPFWSGNNILFLVEPSPPFSLFWPLIRMVAGKGDGNIWYYEYRSDSLYTLDEHKSSEPQRGMYFVPRRASNASECEIARTYKLTSNAIELITFIIIICRIATSERHVQRMVNVGLDMIVDGLLTPSLCPRSLSTSPISPNQPSWTSLQHTRDAAVSIHPCICLRRSSSFMKSPSLL